MLRKILLVLLVLFILVQFIQPSKNNGVAEAQADLAHAVTVPADVRTILQRSCFDCHSNHTNYPWYNYITPVNWWLKSHIDDGKHDLNFTIFKNYSYRRQNKKLEEVAELVEKGEMPIHSYLWIHKDARLNEEQKKLIIDWARGAQQEVMRDSLQQVRS